MWKAYCAKSDVGLLIVTGFDSPGSTLCLAWYTLLSKANSNLNAGLILDVAFPLKAGLTQSVPL